MAFLRKMKTFVVVFALLAILAGGFTAVSANKVEAAYSCCIWVMYCTVDPPIVCWCECVRVPCH